MQYLTPVNSSVEDSYNSIRKQNKYMFATTVTVAYSNSDKHWQAVGPTCNSLKQPARSRTISQLVSMLCGDAGGQNKRPALYLLRFQNGGRLNCLFLNISKTIDITKFLRTIQNFKPFHKNLCLILFVL